MELTIECCDTTDTDGRVDTAEILYREGRDVFLVLVADITDVMPASSDACNQNFSQHGEHFGKYVYDSNKQTLQFEDKDPVKLTTKESELLRLLCMNINKVLERNFALNQVWEDDNYFNARSMDVYITKLRKLLKDDPHLEILNIHGKGYKLIVSEEN